MKPNVGGWDRNTRWILGTGALVAGLIAPVRRSWRIGLLAFAATELVTAGTRYCPVNQALGVNTAAEGLKSEVKSLAESALS